MRKEALLAALVFMAGACRRPDDAGSERAPRRLVDFGARGGAFSCRAPADWKALEDGGSGGPLVMFLAPGEAGAAVMISVSSYPDGVDRIRTPQDYWRALQLTERHPSPLEERRLNGRTVYATHFDAPLRRGESRQVLAVDREDAVLIPGQRGFFAVSHRAPAQDYQRTLPVFEAVLQSFSPKS